MLCWAKRVEVQRVQKQYLTQLKKSESFIWKRRPTWVMMTLIANKKIQNNPYRNADGVVQYMSLEDIQNSERVAKNVVVPTTLRGSGEALADQCQKKLAENGMEQSMRYDGIETLTREFITIRSNIFKFPQHEIHNNCKVKNKKHSKIATCEYKIDPSSNGNLMPIKMFTVLFCKHHIYRLK